MYKSKLDGAETQTREYKSGQSRYKGNPKLGTRGGPVHLVKEKAGRYVSAFLNTSGGILLFGVDDDGTLTGCELDKEQREQVTKVMDQAPFDAVYRRHVYSNDISYAPSNSGSGMRDVPEMQPTKTSCELTPSLFPHGGTQVLQKIDPQVEPGAVQHRLIPVLPRAESRLRISSTLAEGVRVSALEGIVTVGSRDTRVQRFPTL